MSNELSHQLVHLKQVKLNNSSNETLPGLTNGTSEQTTPSKINRRKNE